MRLKIADKRPDPAAPWPEYITRSQRVTPHSEDARVSPGMEVSATGKSKHLCTEEVE